MSSPRCIMSPMKNLLLDKFVKRFLEFADTEEHLIQMALYESQNEVSKEAFGSMHETAVFYLAAHKLAISPMGEPSRLDGVEEKDVYRLEYERLCRSAFLGARVI